MRCSRLLSSASPLDDSCRNCSVFYRPEIGERGAAVPTRTREPRQVGNGGVLVHIGVRSICAGIAALAIGVALESVGRHVVGAASAGLRAESALFSVFEMIRPKSLDHRASLVRVASLETEFAFEPAVEESEPPASTSRHASFGERFLFDKNSLHSTSALRARTSLSQSRRKARVTC